MTEEAFARNFKYWSGLMDDYITSIVRKSVLEETIRFAREVNDNYYDELFDEIQDMKTSYPVKEQYRDDLNSLYKAYDTILDAYSEIKRLRRCYE